MFRLNKRLEYGVIALLYLAEEKERVACVREIAANAAVPETLLSKVMQAMKNVGYVESTHGNHGGYRLARPLSEINLLELTRTLVGPVQVAECLEPGNSKCPAKSACTIITPMTLLNQKIAQLFEGTSLESLAERKAV